MITFRNKLRIHNKKRIYLAKLKDNIGILCLKDFIILLFIILHIVGCGSSSEEGVRTFRYRLASDPPTLDPMHTTDYTSSTVVLKIFEGLVKTDPETLEIVPALAERWIVSDDGLTYTFSLKKGIRFHNERAVISADFRYSFERCLIPGNKSESSWKFASIRGAKDMLDRKSVTLEGMETPDDFTVVFHLNKPFAPFLSYLTTEAACVVAREGVNGDKFTPIGTGPYEFLSWDHDIRVRLNASKNYHGGVIGIERIDFEIVPDISAAFQKFVTGELDLVNDIPQGQLKLVQERYPESLYIWPVLDLEFIGLNQTRPPFKNNPELRRAFCWAVDRERIVENLYEGAGVLPKGILPPGYKCRDETIDGYGYNLEKASELLSRAGYPGGKGLPELTLWYTGIEMRPQIAQYVQSTLKKIGVNIRLKSMDFPAFIKAIDTFEPDMFILGWIGDSDADSFLYEFLHSSRRGPSGNYTGYSNPEFDRLVDEARISRSPEQRNALYRQADRVATEDACLIPLHYAKLRMLFNPEYDGLVLPHQGDPNIPLEKLTYRGKRT